ncbi:TMEM175 family protein [Microbacterium murale]|uniref:TMEM175 family protein n=1 Tax=Microbacterium murale TaxID=1081040 RepID=UPI0027D90BB8|nr:TMEM175 family protein [Microbacterium murale]
MTEQTTFAPERLKAFVDAVVAIAMTLLILPLLESVSEAAIDETSTGHSWSSTAVRSSASSSASS